MGTGTTDGVNLKALRVYRLGRVCKELIRHDYAAAVRLSYYSFEENFP